MSERQKAEALEWVFDWIEDMSDMLPLSCDDRQPPLVKIEKALSADPDLVVLLRLLEDYPMWLINPWRLAQRIRRKFGIRLTDEPPGWEWIE